MIQEIERQESYATGSRQRIRNEAPPRQDVFEPNLDAFKDLYFRSHFQKVIDAIDSMDRKRLTPSTFFRMSLLKIQALFEMHRTEEARALIKELGTISEDDLEGPDFAHHMARLKYLDDDLDGAGEIWNRLYKDPATPAFRFKALLGIANVYYSQKRFDEIPPLLEELDRMKDGVALDEELSFLMLKGNYYWASGKDLEKAKTFFTEVISRSVMLGWYYFLVRGFFGLACTAQKGGNLTTLRVLMETLDALLKDSDNLLLKHLVNKRFHQSGFVCAADVDVDYESKRIRVGERWFDFHKTPMLFKFFSCLYGSNTFVTKDTVAKTLWPHEIYKPRSHDPRIFNIAKRLREIIEAYDQQPVVILSGRFGYKLAARRDQ